MNSIKRFFQLGGFCARRVLIAFILVAAGICSFPCFAQSCAPTPLGLVSWWPGNGNTTDVIGGNNGTIVGAVTYAAGEAGQAFSLNGSNNVGVRVANQTALQLQNFTIEAWIQLGSTLASTDRTIFGYGSSGYIFVVRTTGALALSKVGTDIVLSSVTITDTSLHHVAVTKNGTTVVFYVDGVAYPAATYSTSYSFTTTPAIGSRGDNLSGTFKGQIDEVSIYNRALATAEIQAIYNAGTLGKCASSAPVITVQPVPQAAVAGNNATFSVAAAGSAPIGFQWQFNSGPISGATTTALTLLNVQSGNAGNYSVTVTNSIGTTNSAVVALTVNTPVCLTPPSGLVGWWPGEGNGTDIVGGNTATPVGGATFTTGFVGQAFSFNGTGQGETVGNPGALQLQTFTIDAWIKRGSTSQASTAAGGGAIFSYGGGGYGLLLNDNGQLGLSQIGNSEVTSSVTITDTLWHHVAVTRTGSTVIFYADGAAYPAASYSPTFTFTTSAGIGIVGTGNGFLGLVDEVDVFNRVLSGSEISSIYNAASAGKCNAFPPQISSQPVSQTVEVGNNVSFSVAASGTVPLNYQWSFNTSPISGATTSALSLANVQNASAGNYTVTISNTSGTTNSSAASLTVNPDGCTSLPAGLVGWWPAEGNAADYVAANNGVAVGSVSYAAGEVGQGFTFTGNNSALNLGTPAAFQLQNFTIEGWIKLASATSSADRAILGYGAGGYIFGIQATGAPFLSKADTDVLVAGCTITDTAFHHVAITKSGTTVIFYVDGIPYPAASYGSSFTFTAPVAIGARGDNFTTGFIGTIDELSVYSGALTSAQIQSIYAAGSFGKCNTLPPVITVQPISQAAATGNNVTLSVAAAGAAPLSYQWKFGANPISGATASTLSLLNVQSGNAGNYAAIVSNPSGSVTSSIATLTVNSGGCIPPPSGLVGWWRGEGNTTDLINGNNGTIAGTVTYATGEVGQAFNFSGASGSAVTVPNVTTFQLQDFTIEAWIQLASTSASGDRVIFGYGDKGYIFMVRNTGVLGLSKAGNDIVVSTVAINDTVPHHVAVTKSGTTVVFYVDGVAYPAPSYSTTYTFGTSPAIGARGDDLSGAFAGKLDEVSIYNRALTGTEVQSIYLAATAGKCTSFPPVIATQPVNQTVLTGQTANFSVTATGQGTLTYQWQFGANPISGATASTLSIANAQSANTGNYSVVVSNPNGSVTSAIATLTVNSPGCASPPSGLVGWWQAEGNTSDAMNGNNGLLDGTVTYAAGEVGQAFNFPGGNGSAIAVGNTVALQLENFTIEAWIQLATVSASGDRVIFGYGDSGYMFLVRNTGALGLSKVGSDLLLSSVILNDTAFHHVAVTKTGTTVVFYVDGVAYPAASYGSTFTFGTTPAIGARGDNLTSTFNGKIDEISIYNRALAAPEVQFIYSVGSFGKCVTTPPSILAQPVSQIVSVGSTVTFNVTASGAAPLNYQWRFGSSPISGATASAYTLANAQSANAGNYSVVVTNAYGSVTSSIATLAFSAGGCDSAPSGLVGWWKGEGDTTDLAGGNTGSISGTVTYATGEVGQAFNFGGGSGSGVGLANSTALQLQNFTIEAWIQLASASAAGDRVIFGYGTSGYLFVVRNTGALALSKVENDIVVSTATITDLGLHHVAVTKSGTVVVFYVDGVAYPAPSYSTGYSFGTPPAIGARGDNFSSTFSGIIDEISVYNRALTTAEIQGVYNAANAGKCSSAPPVISTQPVSLSVVAGQTASFSVIASGLGLPSYQWKFGASPISGATTSSLTLNNAQSANAGTYSVVVSTPFGSVTSSNATLTVNAATCVAPVAGLVSWWPGEGNAFDLNGGNNGIASGVTYVTGIVGQAFNLNGSNGVGVNVGNPTSLQLQNFTIEGWIRRGSTSQASLSVGGGAIFSYGANGYGFILNDNGTLALSQITANELVSTATINDTSWHHVAITKTGTTVVFYLDGVAYSTAPYNGSFAFSSSAAIGARGDGGNNFLGAIDELDVYNRALTATEVQGIFNASGAGKCAVGPVIVTQPANQAVIVGGTATFSVAVAGTPPFNYQWKFGSSSISGATASSLVLSNAQFSQAGGYSVTVNNSAGATNSAAATLTVNPPPALIQVVNVTAASALITVPINLVAQGTENALGFSVNFDPTLLIITGVNLGSGAASASLFVNTNLSGKVGIALAMDSGDTFTAGTQELVEITFLAAAKTNANVANLTFGDQPTLRQVSDVSANILAGTYTPGAVTIPYLGFEGDISPLPSGDNSVSIIDWVQEGRFVAGMDVITNAGEFERADCAPRSTLGDGMLTVADWVQVGRYAVGLDPLTDAGGPTSPVAPSKLSAASGGASPLDAGGSQRTVTALNVTALGGQACQVSIQLNSQGNENALGCSVNFDPTVLSFTGAILGTGAGGATLNINSNNIQNGNLGLALALPIGSSFASAAHEVVKLKFTVAPYATGNTSFTFSSSPVVQAVADSTANTLSATYVPGTLTVTTTNRPVITITRANGNLVLGWPAAAVGFNLESNPGTASASWTAAGLTQVTNGATINATLPPPGTRQLYRLHHP